MRRSPAEAFSRSEPFTEEPESAVYDPRYAEAALTKHRSEMDELRNKLEMIREVSSSGIQRIERLAAMFLEFRPDAVLHLGGDDPGLFLALCELNARKGNPARLVCVSEHDRVETAAARIAPALSPGWDAQAEVYRAELGSVDYSSAFQGSVRVLMVYDGRAESMYETFAGNIVHNLKSKEHLVLFSTSTDIESSPLFAFADTHQLSIHCTQESLGWFSMSENPRLLFNAPPFILATVPRSGTHWLAGMLKSMGFIDVNPRQFVAEDENSLDNAHKFSAEILPVMPAGHFIFDHFMPHLLHRNLGRIESKVLVLVRDPRDKLVSNYYYRRCRAEKSSQSFSEMFDYLLNLTERHYTHATRWQDYAESLVVRYEGLSTSPQSELRKILEFLNVDAAIDFTDIAQKHSFERLSEGRKPGQESPEHHYRKGIIGDWKNHFDEDMLTRFMQRFDGIMSGLGYS